MRTIVGLLIVVAVIYGVAWILRQAKKGKNPRQRHRPGQRRHPAARSGRSLALVRAGREVVLVGIAEHGVTPIRTYTEERCRPRHPVAPRRSSRTTRRPRRSPMRLIEIRCAG